MPFGLRAGTNAGNEASGVPDLAGKLAVAGKLTRASAREQQSAGLDELSSEEFRTFDEANRTYREKFGFPFIVCVKEHSRQEILAAFEVRLNHSPQEEVKSALHEIDRIGRHRLQSLLGENS